MYKYTKFIFNINTYINSNDRMNARIYISSVSSIIPSESGSDVSHKYTLYIYVFMYRYIPLLYIYNKGDVENTCALV